MGGGGAVTSSPTGYTLFAHQAMMGFNYFNPETGLLVPYAEDQVVHDGLWLDDLVRPPANPFADSVNAPKNPNTRLTVANQKAADFQTEAGRLDANLDWKSAFEQAADKDGAFAAADPNTNIHLATEGILAQSLTRVKEMAIAVFDESDLQAADKIQAAVDKSATLTATILDAGVAKALNVLSSQPTRQVVEAFEDRARRRFSRKASRFKGQMALVNAVNQSGFIIGLANLENEMDRSVVDYDAQISLTLYNQVVALYAEVHNSMTSLYSNLLNFITASQVDAYKTIFTNQLRSLWQSKIQSDDARWSNYRNATAVITSSLLQGVVIKGRSAAIEIEAEKLAIVAEKEFQEDTADFADKKADWILNRTQKGANVIAAGFGGTMTSQGGLSKNQSAISGAFSGASLGLSASAMEGAAFGGPAGLIGGAVLGGIAGLITGGN